jgi:pyrimidine operon attenuation protein / uracil phosphoribosyltransferase
MSNPEPTPPVPGATLVLDSAAIDRALRRIAHEIIERNPSLEKIALIGIPSRGVEAARRLVSHIKEIGGVEVETGVVDISMHRDDLGRRPPPPVVPTKLPLDLSERTIVLVDDVLYSGRTCRAAMDAISDFGRPPCIQYAVLVDRGHRELPIRPDFIGKNLPTAPTQRVFVRFQETDGITDSVWIEKI